MAWFFLRKRLRYFSYSAFQNGDIPTARQAASTIAQRSSLRPFLVIFFSLWVLPLSCTPAPIPAYPTSFLALSKREISPIADKHGHGHDVSHTRQLHELQGGLAPQCTCALTLEFFVHCRLQFFNFLQQCQLLPDLHLLQGADIFLRFPPSLIQ